MSEIVRQLLGIPYIQNSSQEIQDNLKFLAEEAPGFIADLLKRPAQFPGGKIIAIPNLYYDPEKPLYGIVAYFDVMTDAGKKFNYQYFGWKQGPESGTKTLIIFIDEIGGTVSCTHIGFIEKFKFAPGIVTQDLAGGFSEYGEIADETMRRELEEELGITKEDIVKSIPLGRLMTDAGMTNNHPNLSMVLIRPHNREKFEQHVGTDPNTFQGKFRIYPWDSLQEIIETNDDAFFLSAIARAQFALKKYLS